MTIEPLFPTTPGSLSADWLAPLLGAHDPWHGSGVRKALALRHLLRSHG